MTDVMEVIWIDGAQVHIPGPCECGAVCTEDDARKEVFGWNKSANPCSFCGKPIRISSIVMKHHHLLGPKDWSPRKKHPHIIDEEFRWASSEWAQYEPHWTWMSHGPWGSADIKVHISCAEAGMPHGNFEETVYNRPCVIPEGCELPEAELRPCRICAAVPTLEDVARVAAVIYSFLGPCVYCGLPVKLKSIELTHGSWDGKHTGRWHFHSYKREEVIYWCGYTVRGSSHTSLEFAGHLSCAVKAMPFMAMRYNL